MNCHHCGQKFVAPYAHHEGHEDCLDSLWKSIMFSGNRESSVEMLKSYGETRWGLGYGHGLHDGKERKRVMELIQKFWELYAKIKAGDWPDTTEEFADILEFLAQCLRAFAPPSTPMANLSVEESEAEVQKAMAVPGASLAGNPFLRHLLELALQKLAEELIKRFK